jgi:hypothetical protein
MSALIPCRAPIPGHAERHDRQGDLQDDEAEDDRRPLDAARDLAKNDTISSASPARA